MPVIKSWAVLESETGALDGWYSDYYDAVAARAHWDKERPKHEHKIIGSPPTQNWSIEGRWKFIADLWAQEKPDARQSRGKYMGQSGYIHP